MAVNPKFSQPYNQMGYAHRFLGRYDETEQAFKKYIELIPDDPNPYDSYAELLMERGRFEESVHNYEKALALDPHFVASYVRMYAVAEGLGDKSAMAGDLNLMGNILLEAGRADAAREKFAKSLERSEQAPTPDEVKEAARRGMLFNEARVGLGRGDVATAKARAREYADAVAARKVPFEVRQTHEIAGLIALHEKDHAAAVAELEQANQQDPRVLYHLARAHRGLGDARAAREACRQAAEHNGLNFNYAYVREKARRMLAEI